MPFPLAHPAAILPLRRFCPRLLSFPALVVGSLICDAGYFSGSLHWEKISHRLLAGSIGFGLPAGFAALLLFYALRTPFVRMLPAWYKRVLLPLCERPAGPPASLAVSLLIGAWTHIILDSFTHQDGWFVERLPLLQKSLFATPHGLFRICDVIYCGTTLVGVIWVALCYWRWLESQVHPVFPPPPVTEWLWSFLLGIFVLSTALAGRGSPTVVGLIPAGLFTGLLIVGFMEACRRQLSSGECARVSQ
jgi:hypothetical protein